ncbi:MAG: DUF4038 domain-containing protein [Verrucomicrobiota bacterium]|nr:DUF4038 domain-containing protein [Verrucomicrobiota bacterium]
MHKLKAAGVTGVGVTPAEPTNWYRFGKWAYAEAIAGDADRTYGHHPTWQSLSPRHAQAAGPKVYWHNAHDTPSARHTGYLRKLIEAPALLTRRPDLSLLSFEQTKPWEMCPAFPEGLKTRCQAPNGRCGHCR